MKTLGINYKIEEKFRGAYKLYMVPEIRRRTPKSPENLCSPFFHRINKRGGKKGTKKEMEGATTALPTTVDGGSVAAWGRAGRGGESLKGGGRF